uniref:Uncharacterized protein n=1 Tax=Anguilla anguilla TaxID=7936 RepID=A0A0E9VJX2_ANGAN
MFRVLEHPARCSWTVPPIITRS